MQTKLIVLLFRHHNLGQNHRFDIRNNILCLSTRALQIACIKPKVRRPWLAFMKGDLYSLLVLQSLLQTSATAVYSTQRTLNKRKQESNSGLLKDHS